MDRLVKKIVEEKVSILSIIDEIGDYVEEKQVSTYPDPAIVSHDKFVEKEYFLEDELCFAGDYSVILDAGLTEYGFCIDDELLTDIGDERSLVYGIHRVNQRRCCIELRGVLKGGWADIDEMALARIELTAIRKNDYLKLVLYKTLIVDAVLLEREGNLRMAFFTYFSALEAYVRERLDLIRSNIYSELHEALDYLSLDDKVRIVAKNALGVDDLNRVKIWGSFQGVLRNAKELRNNIAHGKHRGPVTSEQVGGCVACLLALFAICVGKCEVFQTIHRFLTSDRG